jgi:hypothetical protein
MFVTGGTSGSFSYRSGLPFGPPFHPQLLLEKQLSIDLHTLNFPDGEIRGKLKIVALDSDVDGDGLSDPFVYRPGDACSYALCSLNGATMSHQFDMYPGDSKPLLADFDGDGRADYSFVRTDQATGDLTTVYVRSRDNTVREVRWGNSILDDQQVLGDYDGDGKIDIAVFRPGEGNWYILQSSNNQPHYESWGTAGDRACPGDYDKDGRSDLCVIRNEEGHLVWYVRRSRDAQWYRVNWGLATDTVFADVPADLDRDGATDPLVARDGKGKWVFYGLRSSDNSMFAQQWGLSSDRIRLGDQDGDGRTDLGVVRNIDGQMVWFVRQSSNSRMRVFYWGLEGDQ